MTIVLDVIGSLVKVGMDAYQSSQMNEAEILAKLDTVLAESRVRIANALNKLEAARAEADKFIANAVAEKAKDNK